MDPNETLRELREAVTRWHEADLFETERGAAEDMVELVDSLDAWLASGGFLPDAWNKDTESSASRQHYIDTGDYLPHGEA